MNLAEFKMFIRKILDKVPIGMQHIVLKIIIEVRFLIFRIKLKHGVQKDIPGPERVYWISPTRIIYHTNYLKNKSPETIPFRNRVFDTRKDRGKVLDGNWDITNYKFTDLDVYKAFKKRIEEGAEWQDTKFYKRVLRHGTEQKRIHEINCKRLFVSSLLC